jgi:predicted AAA+ superfamily ATPase
MTIKPWREIARPHKDVLEGRLKQSEFAADISQVAAGTATPEYQDPEMFFSRTFITEGMRLLLVSVAQRMAGQGGDPVIQLQTAFGGGKTHTLLAVMHLASRSVGTEKLRGIPPILDEAGIESLPSARVAVLDGVNLSPSQPRNHKGLTVNTLWGELAYQLLGEDGYALIKESDTDGTSPGKDLLAKLVAKASPCVILIDELLAFVRQLEIGEHYVAGTFDSNISFVQALTEAMKLVPNAILLASLPESDLEAGGAAGQRGLATLEKYFGRVESVWKPVATEESFEIVRRRLFDKVGDDSDMESVCTTFTNFYRDNSEKFPSDTQENSYYRRLYASYPIHPEIFDRLYEDWSTLDKFQRTRGVLQYMAIVIHRLWNSDNRDALIMPGSIPLEDATVRNKSIHYLPQGWEPVIEGEVDGPRSEPRDIDGHNTLFGSVQAAQRTARTIFLGSAPAVSNQMIRGVQVDRILLGAVQPGQTIGVFEDVLKHLRDRLHYLYSEEDRVWFDTRPNLRREMESRKQGISDRDEVLPELKSRVRRVFGQKHSFGGIHVFTPSTDVPDDYGQGPRLVVLPPEAAYSKADSTVAQVAAEEILRNRGDQSRQKQNRIIFLAADYDIVGRLKEDARTYLAWCSIVDDIDNEKLNLDLHMARQTKRNRDAAEQSFQHLVREAYKWLICPVEDLDKGKPKLVWEAVSVSPAAKNLVQEIENKLREEEWLIFEWAPIHLRNVLNQWYLKDGASDASALKVWQDCCHYLYLPRLVNDQVFRDAISKGLESEDFFGFASAREGDRYLGFSFGDRSVANLDEASLLIDREAAAKYKESIKPKPEEHPGEPDITPTPAPEPGHVEPVPVPAGSNKTQFYGAIQLDPVRATMDFATVVDEVVQQFTSRLGVNVNISVEIQANSKDGFDENLQRTIKENCNTLRFTNADFEDSTE